MKLHDGLDYRSNKRREPLGQCNISDPIPLNPMIEKKSTINVLKRKQRIKRDVICQKNHQNHQKKLGSQL